MSFCHRTVAPGHFTSAGGYDLYHAAYQAAMGALPTPDRVLDIRTTFGVVRLYRFNGDLQNATPILALPGRASASPVWADNLASLQRFAPIYTVDMLGEPGRSVQARPITDSADQAEWLSEVIQQLPEPWFDILGLSIGGWAAMNLAARRAAKIRSLILVDPVFVFTPMSISAIARSIPASVRWLPTALRDRFASWTANDAPVKDEPVARMIEAGMQTFALTLPAPTRLREAQLAMVDRPVLVLLAGRSRMHDPTAAAAVASRSLRHGRIVTYADASHAINGEYPDRIASDINAFRCEL